jgi:hypothetical protein
VGDVIRFQKLRFVTTDIGSGDAGRYEPRVHTKATTTSEGYEKVTTHFDTSAIHELELPDGLTMRLPRRKAEWSEFLWQKIQDEAAASVIRARIEAAGLRAKLKHAIAKGTIRVVEGGDPSGFLDDEDVPSAVEQAVADEVLAAKKVQK